MLVLQWQVYSVVRLSSGSLQVARWDCYCDYTVVNQMCHSDFLVLVCISEKCLWLGSYGHGLAFKNNVHN